MEAGVRRGATGQVRGEKVMEEKGRKLELGIRWRCKNEEVRGEVVKKGCE